MGADRTGGSGPAPDADTARRILALLRDDDADAAIAAGPPAFAPLPSLADAENAALAGARDRLLAAWAARDRYRARAARLERLAEERRRAREARAAAAPAGASGGAATEAPARRPALPAAAAEALARARARATGRQP